MCLTCSHLSMHFRCNYIDAYGDSRHVLHEFNNAGWTRTHLLADELHNYQENPSNSLWIPVSKSQNFLRFLFSVEATTVHILYISQFVFSIRDRCINSKLRIVYRSKGVCRVDTFGKLEDPNCRMCITINNTCSPFLHPIFLKRRKARTCKLTLWYCYNLCQYHT